MLLLKIEHPFLVWRTIEEDIVLGFLVSSMSGYSYTASCQNHQLDFHLLFLLIKTETKTEIIEIMSSTVALPQIDSFTKTDRDSDIYDDVQFSTSPISTSDCDVQPHYTDDLNIKYENNQEHDSVITYGSDEMVDNYENVSNK